ncbi:hypothetical protein HO173_011308 [Letharia columbiana]|uniref:Tat pathway signal sequence n=1 Tax=Letharia columbiana TaxID=112416 RepID=A0A8H6FJJ1_9LECA|nr:uncharacterized protein HO173_011308 [Letharia columbiana]KAF6229662.1 hypothetical protein HO173_011308 [Letharia columbiana]
MAHYTILAEDSESSSKQYDDRDSSVSDNDRFLEKDLPLRPQQPFYRRHFKSTVFHSVLCTFNLLFCLAIWQWPRNHCPFGVYGPSLVYTPALDAIAYEAQTWDPTNIFFRNGSADPNRLHKEFGPPSPESDFAWAELIQYQNIRLTKKELGEYRDKPGLVELADGSGYYATLSVYHSLHCVKRLHHLMYFDHYYPNKTDQESMLIKHHGQHCLNILLQTVQCNADLSILPMQWGATTRVPIGLDEGHHQCVQWDKIDNWMKERSLDVFAPGVIVHPILGEAYPDGKGNDIGVALDRLLSEQED